MDFETIIGLELHAQVLTHSKMYCGCSASYSDAPPNTHVCPVCLGLPGVLPVINRAAVEKTVMTGIALNCSIPRYNKFDRKNYMYPDLMKGYQVSQYDLPIAVNGYVDVDVNGREVRVGITRVHLEEDTARLTHRSGVDGERSLVDVNRSGVPLMEIVSEPDMHSPEEAREFLIAVRRILRYIGASSGNMEEGAFRCDANVSQRSTDGSIIGPKVEIKNMNSFRSVERALEYEVARQRAALRNGETLVQETRGWLEDRAITVGQRSKEYAHDYRYFPEPDLPPVLLDEGFLAAVESRMPELPRVRQRRLREQYGLSHADAALLADEKAVADYYEAAVTAAGGHAREIAHWVTGELFAIARNRSELGEVGIPPTSLAEIVSMVVAGEVNALTGKELLTTLAGSDVSPRAYVAQHGLAQVRDADAVREVVLEVLAANPDAVADYRSGKKAAIGYLIGQGMRRMKGAGNPDALRRTMTDILDNDSSS
ncbi:MAG: Asp-tRNA(Asn)/Glu-tRNA(Gln) amidotransferase GatCAB subunit B [Chloroflexi bacterium]|nr:MAG: Asp-tRNA(Asn)/Glu-tRNA(Gln) amidotransferase GatCAB subunit B [Chloroflexota bacterium]